MTMKRMKVEADYQPSNACLVAKVNDHPTIGWFRTRIQDVRNAVDRNVAGVSWTVFLSPPRAR